jgi:hypothetical protein
MAHATCCQPGPGCVSTKDRTSTQDGAAICTGSRRIAHRAHGYEWNGTRRYFPDFYIESIDLYIEVKGYETDRDRAKWLQFPEKLCIIKAAEIKKIKQGCFVGL